MAQQKFDTINFMVYIHQYIDDKKVSAGPTSSGFMVLKNPQDTQTIYSFSHGFGRKRHGREGNDRTHAPL